MENALILILLILWIYASVCFWLIARKARYERPWLAWIPIINPALIVCELTGRSGLWVFLTFIPCVGQIILLVLMLDVPRTLGISSYTKYLIVVPFINILYIAYLAFVVNPVAFLQDDSRQV